MSDQTPIDPGHNSRRDVFRKVGPILLVLGGLLLVAGFIDFCSTMGSMRPPLVFIWGSLPSIILLGAGGIVTQAGYAGKITRYYSQELTPPVVDTFNYAAHEAKDGIREVAGAISAGIRDAVVAGAGVQICCGKCGHENAPDAGFCSACGAGLAQPVVCSDCKHPNNPDAKFCDHCGRPIARAE